MKKGMHVHFGYRVHIQTPVRKMKAANAAIFFEFKHWKPKKKKVSTRCFCFLEMDELKEGPVALELYRKPTDPKRKKLKYVLAWGVRCKGVGITLLPVCPQAAHYQAAVPALDDYVPLGLACSCQLGRSNNQHTHAHSHTAYSLWRYSPTGATAPPSCTWFLSTPRYPRGCPPDPTLTA